MNSPPAENIDVTVALFLIRARYTGFVEVISVALYIELTPMKYLADDPTGECDSEKYSSVLPDGIGVIAVWNWPDATLAATVQ